MKPFKFAIVGSGEIAGFYMDHFTKRPDKAGVEFVGACDIAEERVKAFTAKFGGQAYTKIEELVARPDLDAVVVLTLPPWHAELARKALQAGKHVLTEKPLATKLEDAIELVKLARQKNLKLACSPFIILGGMQKKIKQYITGGAIGKPLVITADQYHGRIESWKENAGQFYKLSGGPILDVGPYPLTLMVDWLGRVKSVRAQCVTAMPQRRDFTGKDFSIDIFDHAVLLLEFESGAVGRVDISNANFRSDLHGMEIHGSGGSLAVSALMDFNAQIKLSNKDAGKWEVVEGDPSPKPASGVDWSTGIMELAAAVRENRQPANSGEMALHVLQVLLAGIQSSQTRCEVQLPKLLG